MTRVLSVSLTFVNRHSHPDLATAWGRFWNHATGAYIFGSLSPVMASQETLIVKVVPSGALSENHAGPPPPTPTPIDRTASIDLPVGLGKSPTFNPRRTGFPSPGRHDQRSRSMRSDSTLGAAGDLLYDHDEDEEDETLGVSEVSMNGSKKLSRRKQAQKNRSQYTQTRKRVVQVLDSAFVQLFLFGVLLVALFLTDAVAFMSAPDAVDKPVELTMLLTLIVFIIELIANCTCRENYLGSFYFYMDILGTFSIVADVPSLSSGWLPDGAEIGITLRVSRAAKIGARVSNDGARLVRFFRSVKLMRPFGKGKGALMNNNQVGTNRLGSTQKIAQNLDESMSKSVAVVVLLTILAAPLLLWDDSDTIPAAYHSSLTAVSSDQSFSNSENVATSVALGYYDFFSKSERKPVSLTFADTNWTWIDEYPRSERSSDRLVLMSGDCLLRDIVDSNTDEGSPTTNTSTTTSSCVSLELDIALVNKWTAFLNIGMVLFVITELVLVSLLLNYYTTKLVVTPLERIFNNIKKNMDVLFVKFEGGDGKEKGEGIKDNNSEDSNNSDNNSGLDAMEAAIDKMARLVKHVTGSGAQGNHMFREYVDDENVDDNTRAWLMDMNVNIGKGKKTPVKGDKSKNTTPTKMSNNARSGTLGVGVDGVAGNNRSHLLGSPSPSNNTRQTILVNNSNSNSKRNSPAISRRESLSSFGDCTKTPEKLPGTPSSRRMPNRSLNKAFELAAESNGVESSRDDVCDVVSLDGTGHNEGKELKPLDTFASTATLTSTRSISFGVVSSKRTSLGDDNVFDNDDAYPALPDDDSSFVGDLFDGEPLKAGPELQMRQARARSRMRVQGAVAALVSARTSGITSLPDQIDHTLMDTWDFDVLNMSSSEAKAHVLMMFGSLGLLRDNEDDVDEINQTKPNSLDSETASETGFCSVKTVCHFLERVETGYRANAYHNFQHAVDVTHTVYRYVVLTEPRTHVTQLEKFSLMIAALSHDLDHPGVNNAFLVNTRDPLATVYNDSSVLENAHVACLYNLINTRQVRDTTVSSNMSSNTGDAVADSSADSSSTAHDTANVFALLDDDLYRDVRSTIISCVLHTDMSHHFKMVSQMEVFHELHSEGIVKNTRRVKRGITVDCIYQKQDDRRFILSVILHAADIGNPVKPLTTYRKWADRVLAEFFSQGDLEHKHGLTKSPMMDPNVTNKPMVRLLFLSFPDVCPYKKLTSFQKSLSRKLTSSSLSWRPCTVTSSSCSPKPVN